MADIKHDARRKKMWGCFGCLALVLLTAAVAALFVLSLLAKTGLVEVPFMTRWLYHPSQASREVTPLVGSNSANILIAAATKAKIDRAFGTIKISFSEAEMTTMAKEGLAVSGASLPLPLKSIQVAIDADGVEIFAVSPRKERDVTILAHIIPTVEDGQLKLAAQKLVIGALEIPSSVNKILAPMLDRTISSALSSSISQLGQLVGIELADKTIRFQIIPKASIR